MGNIEEAHRRVEAALESFNIQKLQVEGAEVTLKLDRYDYAVTHYNAEAKRLLANITELFGSGASSEEEIKHAIKRLRDHSEVGHVDFNIRVLEPRPADFARMRILFGRQPDQRVIPVRDEEAHRAYLDEKTRLALETVMYYRVVPTDKLLKQFSALMARTKERSPALLKAATDYEEFNPYKKRYQQMPVTLEGFTAPEEPAAPEAIETVDNSEFEMTREDFARPMPKLKASLLGQNGNESGTNGLVPGTTAETLRNYPSSESQPDVSLSTGPSREDLPHHAEFAEFCERLYEETYGQARAE